MNRNRVLRAILFYPWVVYNLIGCEVNLNSSEEITSYKFENADKSSREVYEELLKLNYAIPASARFLISRDAINAPDIVYYLSKPKNVDAYPIAILCGGSSTKNTISSIIHFHRYLLEEFFELGTAVITVEQWGIDGNKIDKEEFMSHYTRSQRLKDHQRVIEHLKENPPQHWNGKFIFLGVSEGGPLVTSLTELYQNNTLATINWCGAGEWSWREELWAFMNNIKQNDPSFNIPQTRIDYDQIMDEVLVNPTVNKDFMSMTYLYHADALIYPDPNYQKLRTPLLVVAGAKDSCIASSDSFVCKAQNAGAKITYFRIEDMDHYIRKRPDIIQKSFEWLKAQIKN